MTAPVSDEKKILVVDDNEPYLSLVCDELSRADRRIETAATGKEAVSKISELMPDFVLLDFILPDFDGVEVLNRLPPGAAARTRIVLMTAGPGTGEQWAEANARLKRLGDSRAEFRGVRFIPKPAALSGIRDVLEALAS